MKHTPESVRELQHLLRCALPYLEVLELEKHPSSPLHKLIPRISAALALADGAETSTDRYTAALRIVAEQADDEALWCIPETIEEAYYQQELRRLHAAIEGKTPDDCARAALKLAEG